LALLATVGSNPASAGLFDPEEEQPDDLDHEDRRDEMNGSEKDPEMSFSQTAAYGTPKPARR
jgi:hypothetical protein